LLERDVRPRLASHHMTAPFLTIKCDLHPLLRQTDGEIVIVPSLSSRRDHRGESLSRSERWITSPQPQGQIKAASQGVPSPIAYRICGLSRSGSSSVNVTRYFGGRRWNRSRNPRHRFQKRFMAAPRATAGRSADRSLRDRPLSPGARSHPPQTRGKGRTRRDRRERSRTLHCWRSGNRGFSQESH
jgi:hypothetical protein